MTDLDHPKLLSEKERTVTDTGSFPELTGPALERRNFLGTVGGAILAVGGSALTYPLLKSRFFPPAIGTTEAEWGCIIARAPVGTIRELFEIGHPVPGCAIFVMPEPNLPIIMDMRDAISVQEEVQGNIRRREQRERDGAPRESDPEKLMQKGSGWILQTKDRKYFVSNHHVLEDCRSATNDAVYDIGVLPISRVDLSMSSQIPVIGIDRVLSSPIKTGMNVEIVGWGYSVFEMTGTVIRAPGNDNGFHEELFGIRLPDEFLDRRNEIQGMSGSPVIEVKSGLIVGMLFSTIAVPDPATKKTYLVALIEPVNRVFPVIERELKWRQTVRETRDKLEREGGQLEYIEILNKQLEELGP